ncbi:retropepsin-like domain-containing protein [Sphingobacterium multivorum]|nr:retropepsin-like domain-containing protein [Sphingobacterium multivorum]QRQ63936.1 retropepsin-like domain-containing protein [Sphingobacterium multivorum]HAK28166.1 hypothetical protein [Sphingobacterium sp.]HCX57110.1 hypothetical protein [Sphingobacterium sp.]
MNEAILLKRNRHHNPTIYHLGPKPSITTITPGHIVVEAEIEGKKGNFIFDTGGGINLFFEDFAKDLKKNESYNFLTAFRATGEKMTIPIYRSSTIKFNGK